MKVAFRKYYYVLRYYLTRFMVFRFRMFTWILVDAANFLIFPFLWLSIYGSRTDIAGYSRADIVTYYLILGLISIGFTSHIGRHVRSHIMQGDLNKHLIQPARYFIICFISESGYKTITAIITLIFGFFLWLFVPQYLVLPENLLVVIIFAISLITAFSMSQFIEYAIGLTAFWLGETRAVEHATDIIKVIFAGTIAPLTFYPPAFQVIADYLPFKFMGFFPAQVYLGQITIAEAIPQLGLAFIWLGILGTLIAFTWKKGLRTYEGVGI